MNADEDWEVEIRFRRNGRCVGITKAMHDTPKEALYAATTDMDRALWANPTGREAALLLREECNG